jgi:hypothetical protein
MADTWAVASGIRRLAEGVRTGFAGPRPLARPERAAAEAERLRPRPRPGQAGLAVEPRAMAEAVTVEGALALEETALLGLFSGPEGDRALLRLPGGVVVAVARGGLVDGGRVVAVSADGVRIARGDRQDVLAMPG